MAEKTEEQLRRIAEYEERKAKKQAEREAKKAKKNMENNQTNVSQNQNEISFDESETIGKDQSSAQTEQQQPPPPQQVVSPSSKYNPFEENTEDRGYTKPSAGDVISDIPEPKTTISGNVPPSNSEPKVINPAFEKATEEEQNMGAEQLADVILLGYEKAHGLGKYVTKISEDKITQLGIEDKINPNVQIQTGKEDGSVVTIGEFVTSFNKGVDEALEYDKSFNDRVKPPLVRVLKKHKWGLTDEQNLAIAFGQDIAEKVAICVGLKKSINSVLDILMKQHESNKRKDEPTPQPTPKAKQDSDVHEAEIIEPEEVTNSYKK